MAVDVETAAGFVCNGTCQFCTGINGECVSAETDLRINIYCYIFYMVTHRQCSGMICRPAKMAGGAVFPGIAGLGVFSYMGSHKVSAATA